MINNAIIDSILYSLCCLFLLSFESSKVCEDACKCDGSCELTVVRSVRCLCPLLRVRLLFWILFIPLFEEPLISDELTLFILWMLFNDVELELTLFIDTILSNESDNRWEEYISLENKNGFIE